MEAEKQHPHAIDATMRMEKQLEAAREKATQALTHVREVAKEYPEAARAYHAEYPDPNATDKAQPVPARAPSRRPPLEEELQMCHKDPDLKDYADVIGQVVDKIKARQPPPVAGGAPPQRGWARAGHC